jgi:homoserine O-acetyltransferase
MDPSGAFWRDTAPSVYRARIATTRGDFVMEVHRAWAPLGADRFYNLIRAGYYDDSRFTRVVPGYIAQFGIASDSAINALWASRSFRDDSAAPRSNVRGTFAFAMTGPNARTTQIYINLVDNTRNDSQGFAIMGRIVQGMAVVDSLYGGYGENSGGGMRAGRQGPLLNGGNAYVDREFPKLDRLVRIRVDR